MGSHPAGLVCRLVSLGVIASITSCAEPADESAVSALGANGTGISASTTATGFWERRVTYDWTLDKTATPTGSTTLGDGESVNVDYSLVATRTIASDVYVYGTRGEVCVTNMGIIATEGLAIVDQVQVNTGAGGWRDLSGAFENIPIPAQLDPGESHCYAFEVDFTPVAGARYRNTARATITNHSGHLGMAFGPGGPSGVATSFTLPTTYTWVYIDAEADIEDSLTCPTGLTCTPATNGPWHRTGTDTITYSVTVTRDTAPCGTQLTVSNTATLTESTSGQERPDSADVIIDTAACPLVPILSSQGCTPGYWKNHPGSWDTYLPSSPVASVFPASTTYDLGAAMLIEGLAYRGGPDEHGSGEILLRAGIAALLNAAHPGVDYPRTTASVIADVNGALASGDRGLMITLATALDIDNNLGCPLH